MNYRINAAYEKLDGMQEAVDDMYSAGRVPSDKTIASIYDLKEQIREMVAEHRDTYGSQSCRCNSHVHGGDCMCFEDAS